MSYKTGLEVQEEEEPRAAATYRTPDVPANKLIQASTNFVKNLRISPKF
jgi:hypothetical protein